MISGNKKIANREGARGGAKKRSLAVWVVIFGFPHVHSLLRAILFGAQKFPAAQLPAMDAK